VDSGQWTVDSGQWTVDSGQWTVDSGLEGSSRVVLITVLSSYGGNCDDG
jgi:hypothetical protein